MRKLALDFGDELGWAWGDPGARPTFGTYTLPASKDLAGYFLRFMNFTTDKIRDTGAKRLVFATPWLPKKETNVHSLQKLFSAATIAAVVGRAEGCEAMPLEEPAARKMFMGSLYPKGGDSDAFKLAAITACVYRGWKPDTHHAADALCLLEVAHALTDPRRVGASPSPLFA